MISLINKKIMVLLGPTGVGKTDLSIEISKILPVEIISVDSRQLYKYLDIGTAKPSDEYLKKVPHHFINMLNPDQYYSAGQYGSDARLKIREIFSRKKVPLIVGGSGLYLKALLDGFFKGEIRNDNIRKSLQNRLKREGPSRLYQELLNVDEEIAKRLHPNNGKQIIRALEVYLSTGERLSDLHKKKLPSPDFRPLKFGLIKDRKNLYETINRRVERMFNDGLIEEVSRILSMGYKESLNSLNTVGYSEVIQFLKRDIDYKTCVELVKRNSRNYAKRQLTWFRSDKDVQWFNIQDCKKSPEIAQEIVTLYLGKSTGDKKK